MSSRYRKQPAPHDGLAYRDPETHVIFVPDHIVHEAKDGQDILDAMLPHLAAAREKREVSA